MSSLCPGRGAARSAAPQSRAPVACERHDKLAPDAAHCFRASQRPGTILEDPRRLPMTISPVIRLHPDDGVLIARASLPPGTLVADGVTTVERIPSGHKVAIKPIAVGEAVIRYGQIIGFATTPIAPGQHVHVQNCGMGDFAKDYAYCVDVKPTPKFRPAGDLRRHPPPGWPRCYAQLYRHPHLGELQCACREPRRRRLQEESVHRRQSAGRFPQCRRRGRADSQDRLRHDAERAAGAAPPYARRLRAACELLSCDRARPRLRGEPDRRPDGRAEARRPPPRDGHPGGWRHPQDGGSRHRLRARGTRGFQQGQARERRRERI
ncbi:hypothetical protein ACVWZZ_007183 [Bradyrhizobium sp. LM6.10]